MILRDRDSRTTVIHLFFRRDRDTTILMTAGPSAMIEGHLLLGPITGHLMGMSRRDPETEEDIIRQKKAGVLRLRLVSDLRLVVHRPEVHRLMFPHGGKK